jgi:hypothetical protein
MLQNLLEVLLLLLKLQNRKKLLKRLNLLNRRLRLLNLLLQRKRMQRALRLLRLKKFLMKKEWMLRRFQEAEETEESPNQTLNWLLFLHWVEIRLLLQDQDLPLLQNFQFLEEKLLRD